MTVVYLDMLVLINFTANYLLLLGAGRIAGAVLCRWRIALGAGIGALYAAVLFVPGFSWLEAWPCKIVLGLLMPLIGYGHKNRWLRITGCFFAASVALAGVILVIEMYGETALSLQNGVLYSSIDLRLLLLVFIACYYIMSLFFRRAGHRTNKELTMLKISVCGKCVVIPALIDSGHTLRDPMTNRPVVVADCKPFLCVFPDGIDFRDPIGGLRTCTDCGVAGVRLVPYRAVGVECGFLLAIRSESVIAGDKELGDLLVALSPNSVDAGGGYQALIGGI